MDLHLRDKVVLITGGSRGIGRAIALEFAREGARVAICGRDHGALEATADELRRHGATALAVSADLVSDADCRRIVETTAQGFGQIDVLVNNASVATDRQSLEFEQTGDDLLDDLLLERVTNKALATIRCSRAVVPHMRKVGGGRIICVAGTPARATFRAAEMPVSSSVQFAAGLSNSLITNFAKQLAERVARDQILVNVVHPHVVRTDRLAPRLRALSRERRVTEAEAERDLAEHIPIGRIIEPVEIAALVVFLASSSASAITGQSIAVDGGASRAITY